MTVNSTSLLCVIGAAVFLLSGCPDGEKADSESAPSTTDASGSSSTQAPATSTTVVATTNATTTEAGDSSSTSFGDANDDESEGGAECSIYEQDCDAGEKCVPYSDQADLIPDDIRCCPIVGNENLQAGDTCTVEDYFGSCLDNCGVGTFCLDIDGDGQGTCQPTCGGSAQNPECLPNETCFIYFTGVPMCFPTCDPLAQNCPSDQGCYPDEAESGGTGFICLPTVGVSGNYGDYCWLLSNCQPGFVCVTSDFQPGCDGLVGCCTALCDASEEDNCSTFDPGVECVPWYLNGEMPPSVALEDVGVCVIPP